MSEIQQVFRSSTDEQRLSEAERLRSLATDPKEVRYWDGFVLGVRRCMAGEDVWGGETTIDLTYSEIGNGIEDGWRGVEPKASTPRIQALPTLYS
jgi:hypothetical protein